MDELREKLVNAISNFIDEDTWNYGSAADAILDLILNHATKLELVTKCPLCNGAKYHNAMGNYIRPVRCTSCNVTGEQFRPMTIAEVLEWAQDVATWETTPIEGGTPFPDFKGGRVRVRKTS